MSEELKPTQDVLVAEAKAEGQKLEWGPEQGGMSWFKANDLKSELNNKLENGENPWRFPTKDELVTRLKEIGFTEGKQYFSSDGVREAYVTRNRYSTGILVNYDGTFTPSQDATQMNGGDVIFVRDIA